MIDLRLRAYAPNGPALGLLPDALELQAGLPLGDVSALTTKYSRKTAGGSVLARDLGAGLELGLEYSTPAGAWVEPRGGRFLVLKRGFDAADETDTVSLTCPGYMWQLRKARVEKAAGVDLVDGKRAFLTATAGMILGALINEAQARGEITGVSKTFTSALDSAGQAWANVITIYYEPGLDIWSVLDNLTMQGVCDWSAQGRELQIYNPDTALAVDRTTGANPLALRLGRDLTAAPSEESIEDLISRAVLRGENGLLLTENNPTAPTPWGIWTGTISQGGVSDEGTARTLAQADLERGARVRGQYTRELVLPTTAHDPLVTYTTGDYVLAPGASRSLERLRVRQITLTRNDAGVTGNVVLNDRVIEAELRRSRRMSGIVGGATSDGGSGARPTPPGDDRRVPKAPTGLVAASDAYIDAAGLARAQVSLTWAPVTQATDGTPLDQVSYVVWIRPAVTGGQWRTLLQSASTTVSASPFDVGSVHELRVQAVNGANARAGAVGATVSVTMEKDVTPPPVPSAPILTSSMGSITVAWDGRTATNTAMPSDFERVEVRHGVPGTPGPVVATLRLTSGQDFAVVTGVPYGAQQVFAFRAVDRSGNASAWSSSSTTTVTPLVDADLVGTTIDEQFAAVESVATGAQASADGKNAVFYEPNAPASVGRKVGDTWFNTANANRVSRWSGTAWVLAPLGAGSLLAGSGVNLIPNGAGERGDLLGWPSTLTWDTTDMPAGEAGSFRSSAGQLTAQPSGEWFDVQPLTEYLVEIWIKADKPSSMIFVELRNQAGALGATYVAAPGSPSGGSSTYLLGSLIVPTVWTKYTIVAKTLATTTRLRLGALYFNHQNGTERTATQAISGVRMRPRMGADLIVDGSITARELAVGSVTADAIAAGTITAGSAIVASLDAGKITAGTLDAARIAAGTITADKILIGAGVNLLPDPFFSSAAAWGNSNAVQPAGGRLSGGSLLIPMSATQAGAYNANNASQLQFTTPVEEGATYRVGGWVRFEGAAPAAAGRASLYRKFWNPATSTFVSTAVVVSSAAGVAADTWTWLEGTVTIPAGMTHLSIGAFKQATHTTGPVRFDGMVVQRLVSAELIVDGGITARTLAVGAVTADKIAANAVTADAIAAGSITGTKISATAIDGKTITGATIRTAATGARVVLDSEGMDVYGADNALAATFGPLVSDVDGLPNGVGLLIQMPQAQALRDIFNAYYDRDLNSRVQIGQTGDPVTSLWALAQTVSLTSSGNAFFEGSAAVLEGKTTGCWVVGKTLAQVEASAGPVNVKGTSGATVQATGGNVVLQASGQIRLNSTSKLCLIEHLTTPASANMYITEAGYVYRSTSSARYKRDVEDLEVDVEKVLKMRPRTWRDRTEVEKDPETETRYPGFIAEELEEIGLEQFVVYNEAGQPDAIAYDRLTAALVPTIQRQQRQLDDQARLIEALAERLDVLEGAVS